MLHFRRKFSTTEPRNSRLDRTIPLWVPETCSQCNGCAIECPQGAIQTFILPENRAHSPDTPAGIKFAESFEKGDNYRFIVLPNLNCNGCGDCYKLCEKVSKRTLGEEGKASLIPTPVSELREKIVQWNEYVVGMPQWNPDTCFSLHDEAIATCPTGAIKSFNIPKELMADAPKSLKAIPSPNNPDMFYTVQVSQQQCIGCEQCCFVAEENGDDCLSMVHGPRATAPLVENYKFALKATKQYGHNEIIERADLATDIVGYVVKNDDIATHCSAGQFVMAHLNDSAERIPLTIADFDRTKGTITLVIQAIGTSTRKLCSLKAGDNIQDILGPLGKPTEIEKFGHVVVVGGGVGIAPIHPIVKALKEAGNECTTIIGSKSKDLLFWEKEMGKISDKLIVCTDDGSYGKKGFVTDALAELAKSGKKIDHVWAVGPVPMMKAACKVTKPLNMPTTVSINSIMVDGTGMCGGCRVSVGNEIKFTCVDGPEFDGLLFDWEDMAARQSSFNTQQSSSLNTYSSDCERSKSLVKPSQKRIDMPEQPPKERVKNFKEVALGYTSEQAIQEAMRCLQCKNAPCSSGCPVMIDIPAFIKLISQGQFLGAAAKIKEANSLPAVTGRVCPQETQCESKCILNGEKEGAIAIGRLERFVADYEAKYGKKQPPLQHAGKGKKVAIVGSGPAGLTCAGDLAKKGYSVSVFEALNKLGGVLVYGIPEFRLPKAIVQSECDYLQDLNVDFKLNYAVGPTCRVQELFERGYEAVFLGLGAGLPYFMNIPGESLKGVMSSNEFLTRVNLMKAYQFDEGKSDTPVLSRKVVAVSGGGNVALDAARTALRLGAEHVYLVYRRTRDQMPARAEESHHAFEEGVELVPLTAPVRLIGDNQGWVKGLECVRMELGAPDSTGRRRPVEVPNSNHVIDIDQFIVAIGNGANPMLTNTFPELKLNKWGNIITNKTCHTNFPGVFAGGDIVRGAATVIEAMGDGKTAARSIDNFLGGSEWPLF